MPPVMKQTAKTMVRWLTVCGLVSAWLALSPLEARVNADEPISYRRDIQPLLAKACFACHGPDSEHRQADLRLDQEDAAKLHAIVAGDPAGSALIERIEADDATIVMPPPETGQVLTAEQKALVRAWVAQGAPYEKHWAFEPITRPAVPEGVAAGEGPELADPIDRFVRAELVRRGLVASPPAAPHQRLRRVYFDLIGLPPSGEVAAEFLQDPSDQNYRAIVEELLNSPHYGEHMAAGWLDLARYADTNGYQNDFYRSQWPWRDWVIRSFNRHQPYDEFLVEQIAGDLLPSPTDEQLIATGFNRNNRSVTEGGSIEEEWKVENCVDRVETTALTFLGLTLGCARCHDHKYDPVEQREFYQFYAFFNNVDELGVYIETRGNTGPQLKVPTPEQVAALAEVEAKIAALEQQRAEELQPDGLEQALAAWGAAPTEDAGQLPTPAFRLPVPSTTEFSPVGPAKRYAGQASHESLGNHWDSLDRESAFSWSLWVHGSARGTLFAKMDEAQDHRGIDGIVLENGRLKLHLIHHWNRDAIAVVSQVPLVANTWQLVTVTYDGSSRAEGLRLYIDGQPVGVDVEVDSLTGSLKNEAAAMLGQRRNSVFLTGLIADFCWFNQHLSATQVQQWRQATVSDTWKQAQADSQLAPEALNAWSLVIADYLAGADANSIKRQLQVAQDERAKLVSAQQTVMIMRDRPEYQPTYLLKRGQYDLPQKEEALWPDTPQVLPSMGEDQPKNRLGLARWMVDPRNPLVARVAVNRLWAQFFGRGLVEPLDNFGVQAQPPSHPELLDWLASELIDSGWSLQHVQRLIVSSQTYQQASEQDPQKAAIDPANQWLWRGPRQRLSGEQLRDQALQVAGLLQPKIGGPSVFPYQPAGLWEELAGGANDGPYRESPGEDLYRRGLYTYRKRTVLHPQLATFDAPSWEICYVQRATTNTPLQSLALLNGPTYVEAARHLAARLLQQHPTLGAPGVAEGAEPSDSELQAAWATLYRVTLLRLPVAAEEQQLTTSFRRNLDYYRRHPDEAEALLSIGRSPAEGSWERAKWAALTITASTLMNTDEFITKE